MKILLVSAYLPGLHTQAGEYEDRVWSYGELLETMGHQVSYFCKTPDTNRETPANVFTTGTMKESPWGKIPWMFSEIEYFGILSDSISSKQFVKVLMQNKPDVVHFFDVLPLSLKLFDDTYFKMVPSVLTMDDYQYVCIRETLYQEMQGTQCVSYGKGDCVDCLGFKGLKGIRKYLQNKRRWYFDEQLAKLDIITIPSEQGRDLVVKGGIPSDRIRIIPELMNITPSLSTQTPDMGLILFVGAIRPVTGVEVAIKAFDLVFKDIDDAKLIVAGSSDNPLYIDKIKEATKQSKLWNNIEIKDTNAKKNITEYMKRAEVIVVADQWPNPYNHTIMEAMAMGKPVVAGDTGNAADLVKNGVTGLLVKYNDPREFADALSRLLRDPALGVEMGQAGYNRFMELYSPGHIAGSYTDIYQELTEIYEKKRQEPIFKIGDRNF
jgi:glycosyltransferase involved in cell wall biosynthesis